MSVIILDDHRSHEAGPQRCRACAYEFVAVAPVTRARGGSECPRCGEFESFYLRTDGTIDDAEDRPRCLP
jgi:hypothetical protein